MSLDDLLNECGYSSKTHNKAIYDDFRCIISDYILYKGFATCDKDIYKVAPSSYFKLQLDHAKCIFLTDDPFVFVSIREFEKIILYKGGVKKATLLGVYMYIKQFIQANDVDAGKIAFPSKYSIAKGIGSTKVTVESSLTILEKLKLIYAVTGLYIEDKSNKGTYVSTRNGYAINKEFANVETFKNELSKFYGVPVFERCEVAGKIRYIKNKKMED